MIVDTVENLSRYEAVVPHLHDALALIAKGPLAVGRYEFEGGFLMCQEGTTAVRVDEGSFEAHKKYIDVQVMVEGSETMAWQVLSKLENSVPYKDDIWFFKGEPSQVLKIRAGEAYIVYPEDGHMPGAHVETPTHYKKYVIKCPVEA